MDTVLGVGVVISNGRRRWQAIEAPATLCVAMLVCLCPCTASMHSPNQLSPSFPRRSP